MKRRQRGRWFWRPLKWLLLGTLLLWGSGLLLFRFFNPPFTLTMALRSFEQGRLVAYRPVALEQIAKALPRAVVVAEDSRFCSHRGIDLDAVQDAVEDYQRRGRLRGASTITMQVARNLFLWTGGGAVRKVLELPLALALDALWPKRRILEVYLNIAEWGPGEFGAEAAARAHFRQPATALSPHQSARLAAVLPSPRRWSASRPGPYVESRTRTIQARMGQLNGAQRSCFE